MFVSYLISFHLHSELFSFMKLISKERKYKFLKMDKKNLNFSLKLCYFLSPGVKEFYH